MKLLLTGFAAAAVLAAPAHATKFYAVDETNNLITFDSAAPGVTLSSVALQGLTGSSLLGMDLRVADGIIYGHTDDSRIVKINPVTGVATTFANVSVSGSNFAFDFNPTNNNLRIVANNNTNYVYNFGLGMLVPGANVAYGMGPLFGVDPDIVGAAYTNNDRNPLTGTTLYVIDSRNDVLATQNAATGVLTRVGALGTDVGARTSFDIVSFGGNNYGFAQNAASFFSVNLATGKLTEIGKTDRSLFALTAAVPEPSSWAMMIGGFGLVGAASRRARQSDGLRRIAA